MGLILKMLLPKFFYPCLQINKQQIYHVNEQPTQWLNPLHAFYLILFPMAFDVVDYSLCENLHPLNSCHYPPLIFFFFCLSDTSNYPFWTALSLRNIFSGLNPDTSILTKLTLNERYQDMNSVLAQNSPTPFFLILHKHFHHYAQMNLAPETYHQPLY